MTDTDRNELPESSKCWISRYRKYGLNQTMLLHPRDAVLLRELMPESYDMGPDSIEKEWQKRRRLAGNLLSKIIEMIEGETTPEEAMQ